MDNQVDSKEEEVERIIGETSKDISFCFTCKKGTLTTSIKEKRQKDTDWEEVKKCQCCGKPK